MQQPRMIVQFNRRYAAFNAGEQAGFPKQTADVLARQGIVSILGPAKVRLPDGTVAAGPTAPATPRK